MQYTQGNDSSRAMDSADSEEGTRALDEAPANASPSHGDECPRGGFLARLAPYIGKAFNPAGQPLDPSPQERAVARQIRRQPTETLPDGTQIFRARDKSFDPISADPYRGAKEVAIAAVLGLSRTHAHVEIGKGLIIVTLVQPPRRDRESIRAEVIRKLLEAHDDDDYRSACTTTRARRAEKNLAERVIALRLIGTRSEKDRQVRRRVGVQIQEVRSR